MGGCTWCSLDPRLLYITGEQATNSWQVQLSRQVWEEGPLNPKDLQIKKIKRLQRQVKAAAESFSLELESSPSQSELQRTFHSPSNMLTFPNSTHVCIMPIPNVISQHLSYPVIHPTELHQESKYHNKVMKCKGRSVATSPGQWSGTRGEKWPPYSGYFHPEVSFT